MKAESFMRWIAIAMMFTTLVSTMLVVTFLPQLRATYNDNLYYMGASNNQHQDIIKSIAAVCDLYPDNSSKIQCPSIIISSAGIYNYTYYEDFVYADEILEKGGDCKSWTIFYMAIYNEMGIKSDPINIDGHVYLNVYVDDFYCNIDQLSIDCKELDVSALNQTTT